MFLDHTQRCTTVGRTPLDEWSARRRDLYLTTHDTHNRQISMPPVGFEPTISAGERPTHTTRMNHLKIKYQGLDSLIRSVSRVTTTLANVSSVFQLFPFLVVCSDMISKGCGLVAFFASVKASSVCIHLSCLVCIQSVVHGVRSRLICVWKESKRIVTSSHGQYSWRTNTICFNPAKIIN